MPDTQTSSPRPLVTFIVTTYNLPTDLLRECLDSIVGLSLSKEQREIIVVDDGSDISPANELLQFANDIIYIRQPNQGLSAARNMGLRMSTGKFIQFVDGDDCLIQPNYEHCLDIIRYHEDADMVLFYTTNSKNQPVSLFFDEPMSGAQYMETHNLHASACGYIFKAASLGDLRFTKGIAHEDEEFTPLLMLRMHNVYSTASKAYYYRVRNNSITHSVAKENKEKRLGDTFGVLLRLQATARHCDNTQRNALERRVAQLSMDYLVNVIRLTRNSQRLSETIGTMTEHGLYPLPDKHYTKKYALFRHLIQSRTGRLVLLAML